MLIFQDSVLMGGLFFFLSTYLLYFSTKKISQSQLPEKTRKKLNILCFVVFIMIVIVIFAYHSSHYMSNLNGWWDFVIVFKKIISKIFQKNLIRPYYPTSQNKLPLIKELNSPWIILSKRAVKEFAPFWLQRWDRSLVSNLRF